ncbi:unnamed protein product [Sympodiomycopsis kandeliae]
MADGQGGQFSSHLAYNHSSANAMMQPSSSNSSAGSYALNHPHADDGQGTAKRQRLLNDNGVDASPASASASASASSNSSLHHQRGVSDYSDSRNRSHDHSPSSSRNDQQQHPRRHQKNASGSQDDSPYHSTTSGGDAEQQNGSHSASVAMSNSNGGNASATKRMKTARACDSCRRKKIRCDVVDNGSPPPGDPNNGNGGLTCAHCRQYGFNCTFFLPITETRFKKKREREAEEAAAAAAAAVAARPMPSQGPYGHNSFPNPMHHGSFPPMPGHNPLAGPQHRIHNAAQEWPPQNWMPPQQQQLQHLQSSTWNSSEMRSQAAAMQPALSAGAPERLNRLPPPAAPPPPPPGHDGGQPPPDTRVLGPTSLAYIVHSTAFVPGSAIEAHDLKHSQTFEVGASGDGIIKLNRSKQRNQSVTSSDDGEDSSLPQVPDSIRGRLAGDVAEKLVNTYFEKIGYLWPVVTKSEFLHLSQPPPLLLYAMCGVAALDRNVPREVLSAVRIGLNALFREGDLLSNSNALTVRSLLILSLHGDIHGSSNVQSGTRLWNRLGVALRMAQDLGLHRDASRKDDLSDFAHFLEQKRRIWGACVTADRIISVALGHPLAIDLTDCDVRLPSPFEVLRYSTDLPSLPGNDRPFVFNTEMLKLSILFGRVQKTIYSPTGLMKATDEEITGLLSDIDQWKESLPDEVQYRGPDSPAVAGILHLAHACIQMLFFRVFMRISYSCPKHLKFSLNIERMNDLIRWSRESIDWVDASGAFYVDTMQFVTYALVFCATVQYHAWIRRSDKQGLGYLTKLRESVKRGGRGSEGKDDLSLQAKAFEIINLLLEAAQGQWANTPFTGNLNPTAGVENRRTTESVGGIVWKKHTGKADAPGGVYEVTDASLILSDLPRGTVILGRNRAPALVRTDSNDWRPVPGVLPDSSTPMSAMNSGQQSSNVDTSNSRDGGDDTDGNLPDLSNFTYLGGSVWQDESGRPVDRRGSDLTIVLPGGQRFGAGENDLASLIDGTAQQQQQQHQQFNQQNQNQMGSGNVNVNDSGPTLNNLESGNRSTALNSNTNDVTNQPNGTNVNQNSATTNDISAAGPDPFSSNNLDMFSGGADPLMLNDPMMGILDWQAWQTYLAPFSGGTGNSENNNFSTNTNANNTLPPSQFDHNATSSASNSRETQQV